MPYIGTDINYGNLAKQTGTGDGADTTPIAALTYTVPSSESILVFLDGVCQVPSTDFTATGTTLTFTTAPANGVAILVMFLGRSLDIGTPASNTVSTSTIQNDAVDETKLKDALIGDFSDVTVTAADTFLYGDATDSGNTKKDTIQGILDLVSAGMKVYLGSSTFNATSATGTNLVISGIVDASSVAFTPKAVFVIASTHGAGNSFSWLVDPARSQDYISSNFAVGGNFGTGINNIFCECPNSGATQTFTTSAWTSGGYTMANTKAGSATGTLYWRYMAIA